MTLPIGTTHAGGVPAQPIRICPGDTDAVVAISRALRVGPDVIRELLKTYSASVGAVVRLANHSPTVLLLLEEASMPEVPETKEPQHLEGKWGM